MKKITFKLRHILVMALLGSTLLLGACSSTNDILGTAGKVLEGLNNGSGNGNKVTTQQIIGGLKQALELGITKGSKKVAVNNGYLGNSLIKIPFPEDAIKVANTLKTLGMGKQVDKVVTSLNRAAEDAAKSAAPIFVSAIKQMSIKDAMGILKGNNNAATDYLQRTTSTQLKAAFTPSIKTSLKKVDATKIWGDVMNTYNKLPTTRNKINPDLTDYVTNRAMDGLFQMVSKEEAKIRKDPVARTTDLLKKVFKLQDK